MANLKNEMSRFQAQAIAKKSRKTYDQGQSSYIQFCSEFNLRPYPLEEQTLRLFCTYLARSVSHSTILTYLSSIRLQNIEQGFAPAAEMPLLKMVLRGIKREKGSRARPKRCPITLDLLRHLKHSLRSSQHPASDQLMLWASFTTAFFGFLRASEFCSESQSSFDHQKTLLVKDVEVTPEAVIINLKSSKTDQFRTGNKVRLAPTGKSTCPFRALKNHLENCSAQNKPLFTFVNQTYLTRKMFSKILKSLLPQSCNQQLYSSHSFRIGAATCAADKNTPVWLIKALGRWSSDCYQEYIRVSPDLLDKIPALLTS